MKKVYADAKSALEGLLFDDMTIMAGGFGLCGIPEVLIEAIRDARAGGNRERLAEACEQLKDLIFYLET